MKTYLITGGAGFIGSNFVKYMLQKYKGINIIILDKLTYAGNIENIEEELKKPKVSFIKGDICDFRTVKKIFEANDINYVINFAAETHVDRSIDNPQVFLHTNILGTQNILEVAKKFWTVGKDEVGYPVYKNDVKFLQISTDEVYGSLGKDGYFSENTPLSPRSPYSASKASADMIVNAYHETYKLPVNITRCSNNYGPYQFPEKLLPLMIINALNDKKLPIYGDGLNIRDWLHVKDHCSAIDTVLHMGKIGEIYNIGGNNEKRNIEIVELILKKLGKPQSLIKYVKDRLGHDRRYAMNASKIKKELGWSPSYTFEHGIEETIEWYCENRNWWKKILTGDYIQYYQKMYGDK